MFVLVLGVLGLCWGSFLNVVIYRLPKLLLAESQSIGHMTLFSPGSFCIFCHYPIAWFFKIPVISFLMLRGQAHCCKNKIPKKYIFVELLTGISMILVYQLFGVSLKAFASLGLISVLFVLSYIDLETLLLPDNITLPALWLGLICNIFDTFTPLKNAVMGAAVGYILFFLIAYFFKKCQQVEGLGQGDFKLFALLGAWLGYEALPSILLLASLTGSALGLCLMIINRKFQWRQQIPFGPFLAFGGIMCLLFPSKLGQFQAYLGISNLCLK